MNLWCLRCCKGEIFILPEEKQHWTWLKRNFIKPVLKRCAVQNSVIAATNAVIRLEFSQSISKQFIFLDTDSTLLTWLYKVIVNFIFCLYFWKSNFSDIQNFTDTHYSFVCNFGGCCTRSFASCLLLSEIRSIKRAQEEEAAKAHRQAMPVVGDLRPLADALPDLCPFNGPTTATISTARRMSRKNKMWVPRCPLSRRQCDSCFISWVVLHNSHIVWKKLDS